MRFLASYRLRVHPARLCRAARHAAVSGHFLPAPTQVPAVVVQHPGCQQLQVPADDWHSPLHAAQYRFTTTRRTLVAYLDYQVFEGRQAFRLTRWLYAQVSTSTVRPSVLFDLATAHLVAQRVVLPGVSLLARLIARVRERTSRAPLPPAAGPAESGAASGRWKRCWSSRPGERLTRLEVLRTPPTRVSAPALVAALRRLDQVRAVGVSGVPVQDLPEARLARLARHAQLAWAQTLAAHGRGTPPGHAARVCASAGAHGHGRRPRPVRRPDDHAGPARRNPAAGASGSRSLKDLDQAALVLQQAVRMLLDDAVPEAAHSPAGARPDRRRRRCARRPTRCRPWPAATTTRSCRR
ncbi:MAG: DUF4158 domain-containing protein [Hymenobacter sp.]